jgi:hypothetical protein
MNIYVNMRVNIYFFPSHNGITIASVLILISSPVNNKFDFQGIIIMIIIIRIV